MGRSEVSRRAVCAAGLAVPAMGFGESVMSLPLVELRRYRTQPGKRDELIALFEREFVESQEAVGMEVIGTFREPGEADRFTWLRGFADMGARAKGLGDFYFGPVWKAHREAANACIADSDDVLLMREAWPGSGFAPDHSPRRAPGEGPEHGPGRIVARVCWPKDVARFAMEWRVGPGPELRLQGVETIAAFVREQSPNNFPRLPVREGEDFFVWFERGGAQVLPIGEMESELKRPMEVLVLEPTRRSRLHG